MARMGLLRASLLKSAQRIRRNEPLGGLWRIVRPIEVHRVKPGTITYAAPDQSSAEREQWYRQRYEEASATDEGEVVAMFLLQTPPSEWPLADWVFTAISSWKDREPPTEEDEESTRTAYRQSRRHLALVAEAITNNFWTEPATRRLLRKLGDHKRRLQQSENLRVAVSLYQWLRPRCKAAKRHARWYWQGDRFDQYLERVKRGDIVFTDRYHDQTVLKLYDEARKAQKEGLISESDFDTFLERLPKVRPKRSAAFLAGKILGVSGDLIEQKTARGK